MWRSRVWIVLVAVAGLAGGAARAELWERLGSGPQGDGAYGALFDAAHVEWRFPVVALEDDLYGAEQEFAFYGPTCDDADYMKGPFLLPDDIQAGDFIEIGMLGAYGAAMKTGFNGFGTAEQVNVADEPMASLYRGDRPDPRESDNVVSLR